MSLYIAIGYNGKRDTPSLVYLGRDGTAMQTACAAAPFLTVEKFMNPHGIRKNNSAGPANAAALAAADRAADKEAIAVYEADLAAAFKRGGEAAAAEVARLRSESASALAAADKAHRDQLAALERGHAAALAQSDAELKSLRTELKALRKRAGELPPADPAAP